MHRSGTSTLSRALPVFGIELGDRLMPPVAGDNEKGFWEDLDIFELNVDVLAALNATWDSCFNLSASELDRDVFVQLRKRGLELLRSKFVKHAMFGMKDPRFSRLLAFWQPIFRQLDLRVTYLLAVRNPMSVARSLQVRNGIVESKCYGLWLDHTLAALRDTQREERLCVDYDEVLLEPERQLRRVGRILGREADEIAAREFVAQFLDQQLRHTRFFIGDLESAVDAPTGVCELYSLLRHVAIDDSPQSWSAIDDHLTLPSAV